MKIGSDSGTFEPIVEISDVEDFRSEGDRGLFGDRRDGKLYRYTAKAKLAINVALATGRPLLIIGATGCGKSALAFNLARLMQRRYYEFVVTSRSQSRDLFYRFDAVRRLGDAQLGLRVSGAGEGLGWRTQFPYVEPGPLWWILDREGALRRGFPPGQELPFAAAADPFVWAPESATAGSILLIDEIDKAEPDFPNNLLVPLGSWQFTVEEIAKTVSVSFGEADYDPHSHPLVIITSNQQRELPDTFLRRCIVLELTPPTRDELVELAAITFGARKDKLYANVAERLNELRGEHLSAAEFLDAVRAIQKLKASGAARAEIIERSSWRSLDR